LTGAQSARVVKNGLFLVALFLEVPLFLALYWALRRTSLAPALFGSVLGILGLAVTMVGALPHVAHAPLSDLYHAPGAPPRGSGDACPLMQATWGIFDAMLDVGFFVMPTSLILLGLAMLGAPAFGKGFGRLSVVLRVVGLLAAVLQMVDPASMIGAGSYFACLIFYLVLGWKVYGPSRVPQGVLKMAG
jgi:hypothetical protein